MPDLSPAEPVFWFGVFAAVVFYGRFYVQWIASEKRGRSVVPEAFWYMSALGSFLLLLFGAIIRSPNGTFSHGFNSVVYARNLVLKWRERGRLTTARLLMAYLIPAIIVSLSVGIIAYTWFSEDHATKNTEDVHQTWIWVGVGVLGQGLFACRFVLQWIISEAQKKSIVPTAFWYLSLVASVLLISAHIARAETVNRIEWVFAAGLIANVPVYLRNIWLVHHHREVPKAE